MIEGLIGFLLLGLAAVGGCVALALFTDDPASATGNCEDIPEAGEAWFKKARLRLPPVRE